MGRVGSVLIGTVDRSKDLARDYVEAINASSAPRLENPQQIEAVISGPDGATRLYICTGLAPTFLQGAQNESRDVPLPSWPEPDAASVHPRDHGRLGRAVPDLVNRRVSQPPSESVTLDPRARHLARRRTPSRDYAERVRWF